jgi:hypothetical protein
VRKPIACSLDDSDAQLQLGEWRRALATGVLAIERVDAGTLRVRLDRDTASVGTLVALAQREVACCPFFRFAIEIDTDGLAFTATVPSEAEPVLDAFAALVPPPSERSVDRRR